MEKELIRFLLSRPGMADFESCPLWCPYQYPWELEELGNWGGEAVEVQRKILAAVRKELTHPHYSIPAQQPRGQRDLIYAAVDIKLPEHEETLFGYLVISDGEPTTLCIFHHGEEFSFYADPAEPDENVDEMLRMTGNTISRPLAVTIKPKLSPPDMIIPVVFEIYVPSRG
jgi:hypothetical protein